MKNKDETIIIKLTEKGKKLNEAIETGFNDWLNASEMTKEQLFEYRAVKGFHIAEEKEGFFLAYYEKGIEKQIGVGFYREQLKEAQWIFGYICAFLDNGDGYKSDFTKEYLKWGAKHG